MDGAAKLTNELDAAEELVEQAQLEWRELVQAGYKADTQLHHERPLAAERHAHADALERSARRRRAWPRCAKARGCARLVIVPAAARRAAARERAKDGVRLRREVQGQTEGGEQGARGGEKGDAAQGR